MKTNMNLCQCENNKKAFYETFSYNNEHKFGFLCCNHGENFVCLEAFDSVDDFMSLLDTSWNADFVAFYNELIQIEVGESKSDQCDQTWVRLW